MVNWLWSSQKPLGSLRISRIRLYQYTESKAHVNRQCNSAISAMPSRNVWGVTSSNEIKGTFFRLPVSEVPLSVAKGCGFSDWIPHITYVAVPFHCPVSFDFLIISDAEGPNFTACVLCSTSMKDPYFSDQSILYQLRKAPVSVFKVPYTRYKRSLLQGLRSTYRLRRSSTSVIKVPVYQF